MDTDLQDKHVKRNTFPLIHCDASQADAAFMVYAAMKRTEIAEPALLEIDLWQVLRAITFMMFESAFEVEA